MMKYTPEYENEALRGDEDPRPWNLLEEIAGRVSQGDVIVDIGCGPGKKLILLSQKLSDLNLKVEIYGVEPNPELIARARENIRDARINDIQIVDGIDEKTPFRTKSVDIVTSMVAPHDTFEMHRILREGGYAILEKMGEQDKINLTSLFPKDGLGPRRNFPYFYKGERANMLKEQFELVFGSANVKDGLWNTYYTIEGLIQIFSQTGCVRDFSAEKDKSVLEEIARKYSTSRGIETQQHRVLVCAKKLK